MGSNPGEGEEFFFLMHYDFLFLSHFSTQDMLLWAYFGFIKPLILMKLLVFSCFSEIFQ